jgi:acetyltransferase-like isoleucine patch superfamily enzyme
MVKPKVYSINKMRIPIHYFLSPRSLIKFFRKIKIQNSFRNLQLIIGLDSNLNNSIIGTNVYIGDNCQIQNSKIGNHTYFNNNCSINNCEIGNFCSIASNVQIALGNHPTHFVSTHPSFYSNNKGFKTFANKMYYNEFLNVKIGNDVWIGSDVKIMGGVEIGDGAIIAAGAIVTKNIPSYTLYGGIPAKFIKKRFTDDVIEKIQMSRWWDNSEKWFELNFELMQNVSLFIKSNEDNSSRSV